MAQIGEHIGVSSAGLLNELVMRSNVDEFSPSEQVAVIGSLAWDMSDALYTSDTIEHGTFHVIAGYPDKCVSSEAMHHLLHLISRGIVDTVVVCSRRSPRLLLERLLEAATGLRVTEMFSRAYSRSDWQRIIGTLDWLLDLPIYVCHPMKISQLDAIDSLAIPTSLGTLVWIDSLGESPWALEWDERPHLEGLFCRGLLQVCRNQSMKVIVSTARATGHSRLAEAEYLSSLPGQGTLEEVAHIVEAVDLHLPDELGFARSRYVECKAVKNTLGSLTPIFLLGWDAATMHLRQFGNVNQSNG